MKSIEEQVHTLWKEVFGDSDCFIGQFMNRYYSKENLLYIEEGGTLRSMLHLVPFNCNGKTIGVVYALATAASARSKGYATQLLQRAAETATGRGYAAIALIPAQESLFPYYRRQGFEGKYRVEFSLPDDFDFGIDDKENQWLIIMPLTEKALPSAGSTLTLTFTEGNYNT